MRRQPAESFGLKRAHDDCLRGIEEHCDERINLEDLRNPRNLPND